MERKRFLLTRPPLDGHDLGYQMLAAGLRDRGVEVILMDKLLTDEIVAGAIEEDVDFIGYRLMSGDPLILVKALHDKLQEKNIKIPIVVGGIIDEDYMPQLKELGVVEIFIPGSSLDDIAKFILGYPTRGGKNEEH